MSRSRGHRNTEADFWDRVQKSASCWLWTEPPMKDGYGSFNLDGRRWKAHRLSAYWAGQDIEGKAVRHLCNTPLCVRPEHLAAGTQSENTLDQVRSGTHAKLRYPGDVVEAIRAEYEAGGIGYGRLAAKYGMSKGNVIFIVKRQTRTAG